MSYTVLVQSFFVPAATAPNAPGVVIAQMFAPAGTTVKGTGFRRPPTTGTASITESYPEIDGSAWNFKLTNSTPAGPSEIELFVVCE